MILTRKQCVRTGLSCIAHHPFLLQEKERNVGKIRTSAIPVSESLGLALDSGGIMRVQIGCVYLALSESIETRVPWGNQCRREPYESCNDGQPEKHHRRKAVVYCVKKRWE
jgi:hypothetical protein